MTFDSLTFLIFFAIVLGMHRLPISWRARKLNLLIASYLFYAAWNPPFVLLIWISTWADRVIAQRIFETDSTGRRRLWLMASLGVNLGLLGYFKYGGLMVESFADLMGVVGIDYHPAAPDVILPVGISFYTFQTLSYTLDVYLGRTRPCASFLDYALYVTFFPQLVAGPIVRSTEFLPQCIEPRRTEAGPLCCGLTLVVFGLFLKVVLADALMAPIADAVYGASVPPGFGDAWLGTLAFSAQIYCDFAGYSVCAIGVAACLGFWLPINFDSPYAALGFSDFWRRWHVTLSSWLRDYLYIPLGGNRRGPTRTQLNLMITMLLGGLWHGASWTFVAWGALHGAYLVIERQLRARLGHMDIWRGRPAEIGLSAITLAGVCMAWVFFRAPDFGAAFAIAGAMLGRGVDEAEALLTATDTMVVGIVFAPLVLAQSVSRARSLEQILEGAPGWLVVVAVAVMLLAITHAGGDDRAFIYFQF